MYADLCVKTLVLLYSIEMVKSSFAEFEYPNGSYWVGAAKAKAAQ